MLGDLHRCMGCMREINESDKVCLYCGYSQDTLPFPEHLPPRTILNDRYIVGAAISDDCQGITYIGLDKIINQVIKIKEYSPSNVSNRVKNQPAISVVTGSETQYKAYLSDFIELYSELSKMRTLNHITYVYEVFEENNTAYAICEDIKGISLKQFLLENAGEISWEIAKPLIIPIINTLSILHSVNIIHRGISPDNLILTEKNQLKLTDFYISVTRVSESELDSELFLGYAAPEQYSSSSSHGSWTDVYAISAVIYKMLTGTMPPESNLRTENDSLLSPDKLNSNIPKYISNIIVNGLNINYKNRIKTMNDFLSLINKSAVAIDFNDKESEVKSKFSLNLKDNVKSTADENIKNRKYVFLSMGITIISLLAVLIVVFIFVFGFPGSNKDKNEIKNPSNSSSAASSSIPSSSSKVSSSSATSSESTNKIAAPNLVGQDINVVKNNPVYNKLIVFETIAEYNEQYKNNIIFEQNIKPNQEIESGSKIILKVSKGTRYPLIPDYYGTPVDEYTQKLKDLGIPFSIRKEKIPELPRGYVFRTSIDSGQKIDLQANTPLVVYVTDS